ncbi:MAG TPA: hypothetical protein VLQ93_23255, partial [Myxococcaceae bacterium]|nr:hypothetical protein [Myxococcaceae bacterium]
GVCVRFDLPSFLLGYGAGASTVLLGKRLRPLLLELATVVYRFTDSVVSRVAVKQEDFEDLLAEARARARRRPESGNGHAQA